MGRLIDLTGQKFGRLIVVCRGPSVSGKTKWLCECDCGEGTIVFAEALRRGQTKSCGCLNKEKAVLHGKVINLKHGCNPKGNPTSEYMAWASMIQRCENPNASGYGNYGGRGISVCFRWRSSFESFFADMGPKPSSSHSLDRVDADGDYRKSNCRWATKTTQSRNVRRSRANTTGVKGVQISNGNKFVATIGLNGESLFLGRFDTVGDAAKAREQAEKKYWGGEA